jgi:hypothetical protein
MKTIFGDILVWFYFDKSIYIQMLMFSVAVGRQDSGFFLWFRNGILNEPEILFLYESAFKIFSRDV